MYFKFIFYRYSCKCGASVFTFWTQSREPEWKEMTQQWHTDSFTLQTHSKRQNRFQTTYKSDQHERQLFLCVSMHGSCWRSSQYYFLPPLHEKCRSGIVILTAISRRSPFIQNQLIMNRFDSVVCCLCWTASRCESFCSRNVKYYKYLLVTSWQCAINRRLWAASVPSVRLCNLLHHQMQNQPSAVKHRPQTHLYDFLSQLRSFGDF